METSYLHSFLLVVETGSMAEAARRLDITAAAVAQQIRILERDPDVAVDQDWTIVCTDFQLIHHIGSVDSRACKEASYRVHARDQSPPNRQRRSALS